jgi:hypothetical protein
MEDGTAIRYGGNPSRAVVSDVIEFAPNQLISISDPPNAARAPESVAAPRTCCIAVEMPSAVIAAAEVAAVTTGSIAVLTEVVTDIDVLSN